MATNWIAQAAKVRRAFKKEFPEGLIIRIIISGTYNLSNGKIPTTKPEYSTHGPITTFEVPEFGVVNPEEVEILFHSGDPVDSIPDLTDKKNIEIDAYGKTYKVKSIRAVRPAGVTLMYKAIALESKNAA